MLSDGGWRAEWANGGAAPIALYSGQVGAGQGNRSQDRATDSAAHCSSGARDKAGLLEEGGT